MPAIEWLKKYESLKNKLACKTDLDTYFSEKIIGNCQATTGWTHKST